MNRRTFLASTTISLPMIFSGCLESTANPENTDQRGEDDVNGNNDSSDPSENHDKWHLCEDIATEPSLDFESSLPTGGVKFEGGITHGVENSSGNIYVILLDEESDLNDHEITGEFIDETDFETQALLGVQYGITSSSNVSRIKRIEETDDGVHAFGCISDPKDPTADATAVMNVVRFERRDGTLETAKATIVTPEGKATVDSTDGIVNIKE